MESVRISEYGKFYILIYEKTALKNYCIRLCRTETSHIVDSSTFVANLTESSSPLPFLIISMRVRGGI